VRGSYAQASGPGRGGGGPGRRRARPLLGEGELRRLLYGEEGPYRPLTRAEVLAAVPAGARRAKSQSDYLHACHRAVAAAAPYAQFAGHLLEFARVRARYASWSMRVTRPTRARMCAEGHMSTTTYKRCRRWWAARGFEATVRGGWTPHLRPGSLADEQDPNEAAVYVLCVPLGNLSRAARQTRRKRACRAGVLGAAPATRETGPLTGNPPGADATRARAGPKPRSRPGRGPGLTAGAHLPAMVAVLRTCAGKDISEARGAWLARIFARAGWTAADVHHAVHHHAADGRYGSAPGDWRRPGAALFWRLTRWLDDPDGAWAHYKATGQLGGYRPVPSAGQRAVAAAAAAAADRAAVLAPRPGVTPAPPNAAYRAARAALGHR
jgi:hypothetical protein